MTILLPDERIVYMRRNNILGLYNYLGLIIIIIRYCMFIINIIYNLQRIHLYDTNYEGWNATNVAYLPLSRLLIIYTSQRNNLYIGYG